MNWKIFLIFIVVFVLVLTSIVFWQQQIKESDNFPEESETGEESEEKNEEETEQPGTEQPGTEQPAAALAIVIDDLGNNYNLDLRFANFQYPLTLAVLPYRDNSLRVKEYFQGLDRFEEILHLPLEPLDEVHYEEAMLFTDMTKSAITDAFEAAYENIGGGVLGINNHKGSYFTSDEESMRYLLEEIKEKEIYFLDSFTIHSSLGYSLAQVMGLKSCKRDIFLDVQDDKEHIKDRLYAAVDVALEEGEAIAIGHSKENTLNVLLAESEKIKEMGISFVKVSSLCK